MRITDDESGGMLPVEMGEPPEYPSMIEIKPWAETEVYTAGLQNGWHKEQADDR